jgi:Ca-activated chloride channel family protein
MFNPHVYENSRPDGIGVLQLVSPQQPSTSEQRWIVPLKRTELKGELIGPLAALRAVQTYGYTREQCDKTLEAVYRFPLPGDAAVTSVWVRFGSVEIRARLKERSQAETEYEEARRRGRQAALMSRESPDVFTLQVAGLQPDQDVTVETCYVQLARAEGAGWSLRVPLTTAPRYIRSDEVTGRHAQGQPLALLRDPGHRFHLDLIVRGAGGVASPTHALDVQGDGNNRRVRLRDGEVVPDRDCVLTWKPAQEPARPVLQVLAHDDTASGQIYFLALVAPPATRDRGQGVPREIVLLVDHSGSMQGAKWQAADWAVERFLTDLTVRDRFALGLFHNTTRWLAKEPWPGEAGEVQKAIDFLNHHRDSGGTELGVALEQALGLERPAGKFARHVLVITDAEVTDAGRVLRLADEDSRRSDRRRVSVLCIDAAPNALLATELAERGGGVARFLTSQPDQEDIATALDEVLADWTEPVLAGLRLEVDRPELQTAGRGAVAAAQTGRSAMDLGDLPAGRAIWVAGRVPRGEAGALHFRVATGKNHELAAYRLDLTPTDERPALKALFGARQVRRLEYLLHAGYSGEELRDSLRRLGYDPDRVLRGPTEKKVYAENERAQVTAALRDLLVSEALDYGLASAETAFVAVRTEPGKPVEETVAVANALPAGWYAEFFTGAVGLAQGGYAYMKLCSSGGAPQALARSLFRGMNTAPAAHWVGESEDITTRNEPVILFAGVPLIADGEAVLFNSAKDGKLPEQATIDRVQLRFPDSTPAPESLDPALTLLIFVDDPAAPRARMRLVDLVRRRGERPLNLLKLPGQVVRVVLLDPAGVWAQGAPRLEIALGWVTAH